MDRNQTKAINIDFFEDARKQLEKFILNFQVAFDPFPSKPSAAKVACYQFKCPNIAIVNNKWHIILRFPTPQI